MKIPYGMSDFGQIRAGGYFYADKTPFLPVLEEGYRYVVFLRPRRFGKSTLVSMLEHYYDVGRRDRWDALFGGLWVHEHPTPEQGAYLVLTLDFSSVATDRGGDALRGSFVEAVRNSLKPFLLRYVGRVPELGDVLLRLDRFESAEALIGDVLGVVAATPYKIYLIVDEYDHFANRLLSADEGAVYDAIVKKTGFVRTFYAALKVGTRTGALARMLVTGVSPLMLDDLSSGFNIATHASMDGALATLAGFTRADTERAVDELLASHPDLAAAPGLGDRAALLDVLERHYDGYRFSPRATQRVFNSDMVLYFLSVLGDRGWPPSNMLDPNVRAECEHLLRGAALSYADPRARRALLQTLAGEGHIRSELTEHFGIPSLPSRTPLVSLLYYFGMLTLGAAPRGGIGYDLEIPNRVMRELQWGAPGPDASPDAFSNRDLRGSTRRPSSSSS